MWSAARQTTDRSSCLRGWMEKKKLGGASSVFQAERKQLESRPSAWSPTAHVARKRLINHGRSLITFHCKQAKDAFVSWCSVRGSRLTLRLIRDFVRRVEEKEEKVFCSSFSLMFPSLFYDTSGSSLSFLHAALLLLRDVLPLLLRVTLVQ